MTSQAGPKKICPFFKSCRVDVKFVRGTMEAKEEGSSLEVAPAGMKNRCQHTLCLSIMICSLANSFFSWAEVVSEAAALCTVFEIREKERKKRMRETEEEN